jgi:ssDNA-binding replication factor A large subunit
MILKYHNNQVEKKFQRIEFDEEILNYLKTIIVTDMKVQKSIDGKTYVQKDYLLL